MRKLLAALFVVIGLATAAWTISLSLPSTSVAACGLLGATVAADVLVGEAGAECGGNGC